MGILYENVIGGESDRSYKGPVKARKIEYIKMYKVL